jgi:hypothetical protein
MGKISAMWESGRQALIRRSLISNPGDEFLAPVRRQIATRKERLREKKRQEHIQAGVLPLPEEITARDMMRSEIAEAKAWATRVAHSSPPDRGR